MQIDRRRALSLVALGASALAPAARSGEAPDLLFAHGVASGDPLRDRVVIWTRATTHTPGPVELAWEVAEDEGFARVVASGRAAAAAVRDHTVKVDVGGLKPGRD